MSERRGELRMPTTRTASIVLLDCNRVMPATVMDISLTGARLKVPVPVEAGTAIHFSFYGDAYRYICKVAWSKECEIGVNFESYTVATSPSAA